MGGLLFIVQGRFSNLLFHTFFYKVSIQFMRMLMNS